MNCAADHEKKRSNILDVPITTKSKAVQQLRTHTAATCTSSDNNAMDKFQKKRSKLVFAVGLCGGLVVTVGFRTAVESVCVVVW